MDIVTQDISNVKVPETKREPPRITCNPKPEVIIFSSPPQQDQPSELNLPGNLQEVPQDLQDIQTFSSQM